MGEYIGGDKAFNKEVMHLYIDSISFERMKYVDALRYLCSLFMLPGEAQKIDRIIERFAARYCQENAGQFSSGDVAYILAYSIILLHSGIYNANVKKKMTRQQFIDTCKSATTEVKDEELSDIYDNICAKEMKLKDTDHIQKQPEKALDMSPSRRMMSLHQESRLMIRDVRRRIRDEAKNAPLEIKYMEPNDTDSTVCKLIFSASCYAVLATFSVVIETSENRAHLSECFDGYQACIQLAAHLDMNTECEAFVNSLYRFTLLGTLKPIRMKNVEAMKLLLELGNNEGNMLRASWKAVIQCCSEIDILHSMAQNAPADGAFWLNKKSSTRRPSVEKRDRERGGSRRSSDDPMQAVRETGTANHESRKLGARTKLGHDGVLRFVSNPNAELVSANIDQNTVAKVFTGTEKLGPRAILDFVANLCEASTDEIHNHVNPRSFCLQKIVDIAHFNMHRVRFEWIQLWTVLSAHFELVGCHRNQQICMYAIDNLKQLADKFLEREELTTFNFQKDFLKPFLTIVARSQSVDIQEYIIQCIARLIRARYKNIKSGWKCVFGILGVAARVKNEHLVGTTFDIMIEVLDLYFPMIAKMSTRPQQHQASIFKIPDTVPEDSTIDDATVEMSKELTNHSHHTVENKMDDEDSKSASGAMEVDEAKDEMKDSDGDHDNGGNQAQTPRSKGSSDAFQSAFESEEQKQEHISKIQLLRVDAISDCVDTLLAFVGNEFTDLSISGVDHISKVAQYLFESDQFLPKELSGSAMMESDLMLSIDNVVSNASIFEFTSSMNGGKPDLSRPLIKAWFLCLLGLSKGVNDRRLEVRTHCLQVLFRLLKAQGEMFDDIMWQRVFERLLFPIFAELRQNASSPPTPESSQFAAVSRAHSMGNMSFDSIDMHQKEKQQRKEFELESGLTNLSPRRRRSESLDNLGQHSQFTMSPSTPEVVRIQRTRRRKQSSGQPKYDDYTWLETTCHPALSNLVELFHQFFFICQPLLHDVLSLLCTFIVMKQSADAAQIGQQCLKRLIQALGSKLKTSQWTIVIADLVVSLKRTVPKQLDTERLRQFYNLPDGMNGHHPNTKEDGNEDGPPNSILNVEKVSVLCNSQLLLINILAKIPKLHLRKLTLYQCVDILNAFQSAQDFVLNVTKDADLMQKLQKLSYSVSPTSKVKGPNLASLLYKLESTAFHSALLVLFECKNASIRYVAVLKEEERQRLGAHNDVGDGPMDDDEIEDEEDVDDTGDHRKVELDIDENVKSQILTSMKSVPVGDDSSGALPPLTPFIGGIEATKSVPDFPDTIESLKTKKLAKPIVHHKLSVNDVRQLSEYRLIPLGIRLMQLMYVRERKQKRSASDTRYLVNVVSLFLKHLLSTDHFTEHEFQTKIRIIFPYLSRLIECEAVQIRALISKILLSRVSKCIVTSDGTSNGDEKVVVSGLSPLAKNNSV